MGLDFNSDNIGNYGTTGNVIISWGYIGIMEKNMETTIVYWGSSNKSENSSIIVSWGHIGIIEKNMETTIVYWGSNNKSENSNRDE